MPQVLKRYIYYIYRRVEICIICKVKIVLMQISITDGIIKQTITNVLLVGETKNDELYYSRNGRVPGSCSSLFDWLNSNQPAKWFSNKNLVDQYYRSICDRTRSSFGAKKDWNPQLILFLKVGICGGFTTFSSFALETNQLMERGSGWWAALYVALSVTGAMAAVYASQYIVAR